MRGRAWLCVWFVIGCRSAESPAPQAKPSEGVTKPAAPAAPAPVAPAAPATSAAPAAPAAPAPAAPAPVTGAGTVTAAVENAHFVVRVAHGAATKTLVDVPAQADEYDQVTAASDAVQGSEGRVVLVQKFAERGEDEFSRSIQAWIIDAARDEILWTGTGSYANSFDECETLDVPAPSIENGAVVVRVERGTKKLVKGSKRCRATKIERTVEATLPLC